MHKSPQTKVEFAQVKENKRHYELQRNEEEIQTTKDTSDILKEKEKEKQKHTHYGFYSVNR